MVYREEKLCLLLVSIITSFEFISKFGNHVWVLIKSLTAMEEITKLSKMPSNVI